MTPVEVYSLSLAPTEDAESESLGKPLILGGLDIPGSTRHLDIEAIAEVLK